MTGNLLTIRPLQPEDWPAVKGIYESGLATGNASFETQAPEWEKWHAAHLLHSRLVAVASDGQVAGWVALSPVSVRAVYRGVAEVSVYIGPEFRGMKVGQLLLESAIEESERNGIWTLQAGIFPENAISLHLHQKNGFRQIGYRERIGQLNGVWRNTVQLERRSKKVGLNESTKGKNGLC